MALQISVIGSGRDGEARAEEVGRLVAERGAVLVCGGRGEVMAAAARGAKSAGGTTIGILPGESRKTRTSGSTMPSPRESAMRGTWPWSPRATP